MLHHPPPKIKITPKVAEEFWADFKYNYTPEPFPKWKKGLNTGEGLSTCHVTRGLEGEKND